MSVTSSPPSSPRSDEKKSPPHAHDAESLVSETTLRAQKEGIKPAFLAKVEVLNRALAEIGMGRYQYELFISGK
jgi:hypothetical protein